MQDDIFRQFIEGHLDLSGIDTAPPTPTDDVPPPLPDWMLLEMAPYEGEPPPDVDLELDDVAVDIAGLMLVGEIAIRHITDYLNHPEAEINWAPAFTPQLTHLQFLLSGVLVQYAELEFEHSIPMPVMQRLLALSTLVTTSVLYELENGEDDDEGGITIVVDP